MPATDFDFLHGSWTIHNRRLDKRLAGCTTWSEFDTTAWCKPIFGGAGNVDEFSFGDGESYGLTVRIYEPSTGLWWLMWGDSGKGRLLPPLAGSFTDGAGTFHGTEQFEGRTVKIRYVWSKITPTSAQWEQALSDDGGESWETNWYMQLTRTN
jgi:hypothetical protein